MSTFLSPSLTSDPTEGCFNYPLVEKFLMTKRCSRKLLFYYLLCRSLNLVTLLCTCIYLGYYLRPASVTDEFGCQLRVGLLASDPSVPEKVQCKLIAVGVFSLLRSFYMQCGHDRKQTVERSVHQMYFDTCQNLVKTHKPAPVRIKNRTKSKCKSCWSGL